MQSIMKLFLRPIAPTLTLAEIASTVMYGIGPVALVIGIMVLPIASIDRGGILSSDVGFGRIHAVSMYRRTAYEHGLN